MNNTRVQEWKAFVADVRKEKPLVHHITNNVTMNFLANGVLAAGGSPMMVHDAREVEEAVGVADALVLNIGTLDEPTAKSMILACRKAMQSGVPVVLDPVGIGLSAFRQEVVNEILSEYSQLKGVWPRTILTICGNAAEIQFLAKGDWTGKGVDGEIGGLGSSEEDLIKLASAAAKQTGCLIAMTGEKDVISDGEKSIILSHGDPMLAFVTGTGCFATSMVALYQANRKEARTQTLSILNRTALAILMLTKAAEEAVKTAKGPGSFQQNLIDQLFVLESTPEIWQGSINWRDHTLTEEARI
ncbi:hydroxyethylthiazole kinase [Fictibacillus sp. b24]|uniref:hydroxyethylthiazole kinase n=1 Tax=Fictibacillus sp. b24 TaxID=3055863 RepID=UPI0025A295DF|nr:hydroxyethylthiazole kinase [Fictibacillus sp. b24]MDM5316978.1 hydroxyethylthiazole kinase [Fictibacillus sp. b24]